MVSGVQAPIEIPNTRFDQAFDHHRFSYPQCGAPEKIASSVHDKNAVHHDIVYKFYRDLGFC